MLDLVILVSITVIVGLASHIPIQSKRPKITSVKEWKYNRLDENQRTIYEWLTANGYYVSCNIQEQSKLIPLALEPFRIALLESKNKKFMNKFLSIYFSMKGWKTIFFSKEVSQVELLSIVSEIEAVHDTSGEMKRVQ
ncbi:hypothetical protein [Salipaludibacillus daqingensis]|uniref:hypothetical protein n=1 Tax=Salipaludibacillus daqingensis TaxID=3041001 RepID=UPI0024756EED|nr:hypothetical protein [Salipaludibacillus daqingensis]